MKVDSVKGDGLSVTIPYKRWSKDYVARILGPDTKWAAERKRLKPTVADGTAIYRLTEPGWYEVQRGDVRDWLISTGAALDTVRSFRLTVCESCGQHDPKSKRERSDIVRQIASAARGPLPGKPGAWNGETCKCGKPVASFDPEGWPRCVDCEKG